MEKEDAEEALLKVEKAADVALRKIEETAKDARLKVKETEETRQKAKEAAELAQWKVKEAASVAQLKVKEAAELAQTRRTAVQKVIEMEMEQKLLKASEDHYRTLVEWAPDAVIVQRDGRFLYVNCPALGIYRALTREQLQGENFFELIHHEDQKAVNLYFERIQCGEKTSLHEFRLVRSDDSEVTVEAAGIMINYEGTPAYLIILRDTTERKRMEQERLRAIEELHLQDQTIIKQARFAAMGEMIGNIAHQWRQPLNILGLIVQEMPVYYKLGRLDQHYIEVSVDKAMQTIKYMSKTIDDFRDFVKTDKEKLPFRVSELVQKAVSMVEVSFKLLGLRIQIVVDDEVNIEGYPNEYAQVILNILMNAKDALLESKTENHLVVLRLFKEHGKTVLTVTDNAGGIPDAIISRLFDPYFTTKGPDRGTGIGLFMSKNIIERNMGGSLTVSNVTGGAEFRIEV
jgi:PAS domain S-box-containing protein